MKKATGQFGIPYRSGSEIRELFIHFFKERGHRFVPSAPIHQDQDPTLLFTNSGMNQFKGILLGHNPEGLTRAANSQKCLRVSGKHNDLDVVGRDGYHHTFFEMLGNWSFGDYGKKQAILWAWELLTEVFQMPKSRLFITVHREDDACEDLWKEHTDVDPSHILRFDSENFWEMGATGPCGPCSEIYFDLGDPGTQKETFRDPVEGIAGPNERYVEIWNLVFMQSERLSDGSLKPLAASHVDTGSGLERMARVIQGVSSNYETDLFASIIEKIEKLTGVPYDSGPQGTPHRVMSDHIRALVFAIGDLVTPGNEGRGYVMRRILRRALRFSYELGVKKPLLYQLVPVVVSQMEKAYPELKPQESFISSVILAEEERFLKTLGQGMQRIHSLIEQAKKNKRSIQGPDLFLLHDTYGFPIDLTRQVASEENVSLDEEGFEKCMGEQQERARQAQKFSSYLTTEDHWKILVPETESEFIGYTSLSCQTETLRYAEEKDSIFLILRKTPFYAESGGQVGDTGRIIGAHGLELGVVDTFKMVDFHLHQCVLLKGLLSEENLQEVEVFVDAERREKIRKNHSATHLLHSALRKVLGTHVVQQGSHVGADRLRFDYTHTKPLSEEQSLEIEKMVNAHIQKNVPVETKLCSLEEAKKSGAMALFGEKYDHKVRVLSMGDVSLELCGGTHVSRTGDIGLFKIQSDASIASGVRRCEAITSDTALSSFQEERKILRELQDLLKSTPSQLKDKTLRLLVDLKESEKERKNLKSREISSYLKTLFKDNNSSKTPGEIFVAAALSQQIVSSEDLTAVLDASASLLEPRGMSVLTYAQEGQTMILVSVSSEMQKRITAHDFLQKLGQRISCKGGGRKDKARGVCTGMTSEEVLKEVSSLN